MLFKILHGDASRISTNITPYHEGYCYVTHDGYFYVDMNNERVKLNSEYADMLRYVKDGEIIELDPAVIASQLANKVDKVSGKGLSTNDFTATYKSKLDGIAAGANKTVVDSAMSSTSTNPVQNKIINAKVAELQSAIDGKAASGHNHNSDYDVKGAAEDALESAKSYTDTVASGKASVDHNHDEDYDAAGSADSALASAKSYTNTKISGLASTTVVDNKISSHNTSNSAHSDIRDLITGLTNRLNALADSDDTTLDQMSEIVAYIKSNKGLIDSITTNKVDVSAIVNNLTTNATNKPLAAAQGVAIKSLIDTLQGELDSHTHAIADVSGLQTALDGKAATSHGTHVSYSTTAPVMDGTAGVGSASTVARSDHKHPTDTSRASKSEFDTHVDDTTAHMTSTQKTQLSTAYNHSQAAHAPSNAQANQNAFSNIAVSGQTTVAADTTTDTVTFAGSNVSITTDATNDKVTFSVADASTGTKGVVQLTNSTSSTSTTTAATPSSVKSAYDLANTAKTNAATAQTRADSAYTLAESKVDSLSDLGITATANELNYMDGVTSGVQAQLNGKSDSGHTHNYAGSSSAGGAATSANKVNSALTMKLNGGTTEGTNLFTFNGSAAKSVNITPSAIGAAASSHTHDDRYYTESEIDTKVSSLQTSINGKADSSHTHTIANVTNLQATLDGKASSSHGHGNITNAGAIGTTANKAVITTTNGVLTTGTVPVSSGGTGATTAAAALTNLGLTATAAELNYVDGVTSNIQTQLNGKAASSHTHSYLPLSGGTIDGELKVQGYDDDYLKLNADIETASFASVDGSKNATLVLGVNKAVNEKLQLTTFEDGTLKQYKIYGEHNKPTAADVGAAPAGHGHNYAGSASDGGSANSAVKLETARTIKVKLGSTSAASFDGTGNITPGVSGTLPIARGGTGGTNAATALSNLGAAAAGHDHNMEILSPSNLEFVPNNTAHGGYIDFHFNKAESDYTSRIIEDAQGVLNLQSTQLLHNGLKILTDGIIVDSYNASVKFTNGVATYNNVNIKPNAVVMVSRRGNIAGANTSYCTHTNSNGGSVTICCNSSVNETHSVNIIISNI